VFVIIKNIKLKHSFQVSKLIVLFFSTIEIYYWILIIMLFI